MKRFILLAAAAVVLASCGGKQYSYWDLVFDYPSLYKLKVPEKTADDDPDHHLFFIEDGLENSLEFVAIDIVKEDPDAMANADPELLSEYLAERAFGDLETMALDDDEYKLYDYTESEEKVSVTTNPDTGLLEAHAYAKGHWNGEDIFVDAYATTFDGRYTITMCGQSQSESYMSTLVKIYRSVHKAESK